MTETGVVGDPTVTSNGFRCRSCASTEITRELDLGEVPASDHFPSVDTASPDPSWPLELWVCHRCHLIQLGPATELPPEEPGPVDSATAMEHARRSVRDIVHREGLTPGMTFIEYDSGHGGSWKPEFERAGLVQRIPGDGADLVADVHHLMHTVALDKVLSERAEQLAPGGVFVSEFFHARPMVSGTLIDTVRHGHYLYLTLCAAVPAWRRHGLVITDAVEVPAYGGSLRVTARRAADGPVPRPTVQEVLARERAEGLYSPSSVAAMAERGRAVADAFRTQLIEFRDKGLDVAAYGAPSKAAVLLSLAKVDHDLLPVTVDRSTAKEGRRIPGAGVPIRPVTSLVENPPDIIVVLTWDIAEEIADQLRSWFEGITPKPELFVPLPSARRIAL